MNTRWRIACGVVLAAVLAWHGATHLKVTSAITHFLPAAADSSLARISESLAESELTRTLILAVHGPDQRQVVDATTELADALQARPELAWLRRGVPEDMGERVFELYYPQRFAFASLNPEVELAALTSNEGLRQAALALKHELASPTGSLMARLAPADPFLLFQKRLGRIEASRGPELQPFEGHLVSADGTRAFLFMATRASAFDTTRQAPLLDFIDSTFAHIDQRHGGGLSLEQSGLQRFAVENQKIIVGDIERVSSVSFIGVVLLFLFVYRSARYVALGLVPFGFGMLCATSMTLFLFGEMHAITLAFGSTLIGVCIDYPVHYFNHHILEPHEKTPSESLREVWPGLFLGCLTSVVGFAGLGVSSFPGIREVAVFGATGVVAALYAMRAFVPPLLPPRPRNLALQRRFAAWLERGLARVTGRPLLQAVPLVVALFVTLLGVPHIQWQDDLRALAPADPKLLAESESLRSRISAMDAGRFVIALGKTTEEALVGNEQVAAALDGARRDELVAGYQSLETWLWSESLQRRNLAMFNDAPDLAARVQDTFTRAGFEPAAFEPFAAALRATPTRPLLLPALLASPLADVVRHFAVPIGDQVGVLTYLRGVRDPDELSRRLQGIPNAVYFDQTAFLTQTYSRYRSDVVRLSIAGLVAVLLVVWLHYRRLSMALAALLPAVLAASVTAVLLAWAGRPLTLLHVMAMLLVLGMSVDYGVFLTESVSANRKLGPTLLSLVIASLTTVLSFGLLAVSRAPALKAIGETTALGMLLSMLLAPASLFAMRATKRAP